VAERLPLVRALVQPTTVWFDRRLRQERDALLIEALSAVERDVQTPDAGSGAAWGDRHRVTFAHPLAVGEAGRRRFNIGPIPLPGYSEAVFATAADGSIGPSFRAVFDLGDWDRSV